MQSKIFQNLILLCTLVVICFGKHTVRVDNVFPNLGDTVLVSGPFTSDSIFAEVFDVGSLTINSLEGLSISTNNGISFDGSSLDGEAANFVSFSTTDESSDFSVMAATTMDLLGGDFNFFAEDLLNISALGNFELLGDLINIFADSASLSGESLVVSAEIFDISFFGESISSSSSALSFQSKNSLFLDAGTSLSLDIQQAIEIKSSKTSFSTTNFDISALRNNILLEGYVSLDMASKLLDVQVKGDATIESSNGNILFQEMQNISFQAQDDIVLDAHDSARFTSFDDVSLSSSGNTYLISDAESFFTFQSTARFTGGQSFSTVDNEFMVESTSGNVVLSTSAGPLLSQSADYTKIFADAKLSVTAEEDIVFTGTQGFDIRAERGRFYVGKFPADPSGQTPITFNSKTNLFFDAGDLSSSMNTLDILADVIRFETADTARDAVQDWNINEDMNIVSGSSFFLGSSDVFLNADQDLTLDASNVNIQATSIDGSSIGVSIREDYTETASGSISHFSRYFELSTSGDLDLSAESIDISGLEGVSFEGETTISITTPDLANNVAWESSYQSTGEMFVTTQTDLSLVGGRFEIDNKNNMMITTDDNFSVAQSANLDFDADNLARYDITDAASFFGNRFIVINGDQTYSSFEDIVFQGNFINRSPPSTDISFSSEDFSSTGPLLIDGYELFVSADDISFTPFSFEMKSNTEEEIIIGGDQSLQSIGDDITFASTEGDLDNEFHFVSEDSTTITAEDFYADIDYEASAHADTFQIFTSSWNTFAHNVELESSFVTFDAGSGDFSSISTHITRFFAEHNNLIIEVDDDATFFANGDFYLRSNDDITVESFENIDVSTEDEFSFVGGNVELVSNQGNLEWDVSDNFDIHGFSSFLISSLGTADFDASIIDVNGKDLFFTAADEFTLVSEQTAILSGPGKSLTMTQTSTTQGSAVVSGDSVRYQSNDMMLFDVASNFAITAGDALFETSARDAGQLYYAFDASVFDLSESIVFSHADEALHGASVFIEGSESVSFFSGEGILLEANGSTFDSDFDSQTGLLFVSESDNIRFTVGGDLVLEGFRSLLVESLGSDISHETTDGGFLVTSFSEGMVVRSADEFNMDTDSDYIVNLLEYSIWQTSDVMSIETGLDFSLIGKEIDLIADRGEISFNYDGDFLMFFESTNANLVGQGASSFDWRFSGDVTSNSPTLELFGDSLLEIDSNVGASGLEQQILIQTVRDAFFISSLNNDILFSSGTVIADANGFIDVSAGVDVVWRGDGGDNSFSASLDMLFESGASITSTASDDTSFSSAASLTITASNLVEFEVEDDLDIGSDAAGSIISVHAGGDTSDHGVSVTSNGVFSHSSEEDISIIAAQFYVESNGFSLDTTTQSTFRSQGADSFGTDVSFESLNGLLNIISETSSMTGKSVRYEYDSSLSLTSTDDVTLSSATFVDVFADETLSFVSSSNTLTAATHAYNSDGDTIVNNLGRVDFTTLQRTVLEADDNIEFFSGGESTVRTQGANAPISLETQGIFSEFNAEFLEDSFFTAAKKVTISGKEGVQFNAVDVTLSAADDFIIDAFGDVSMIVSNQFSIDGENDVGAGSPIEFSSSGTFLQDYLTLSVFSDGDLSFIPDKDLTFSSLPELHYSNGFTMSVGAKDNLATIDGNYNVKVGDFQYAASSTIDLVVNGINTMDFDSYGLQFTSLSENILSQSQGSLLFFAQNIELESNNVFTVDVLNGPSDFISQNGSNFLTEETSSNIQINGDQIQYTTPGALSISASGSLPSSGWIDISATGSQTNQFFDEEYTVGFITTNSDINIDIADARFIMENLDTATVRQASDGSLNLFAFGSDENGYGVDVQTTDLVISSGLNIFFFAEHIEFTELFYEPYLDIEFGNLDPTYDTTVFRPTFQSIHDQTYTSNGYNENGNGIEIRNEVPYTPIVIDGDNVNFDSSGRLSVIADSVLEIRSNFQNTITTPSSLYITGEGVGADTNSVAILASEDSNDSPSIEFFAERDIFLESSNAILGSFSRINVLGEEMNIIAGDILIDVDNLNLEASDDIDIFSRGPIDFTSAQDINFSSTGEITIQASSPLGVGFGSVYFGSGNSGEFSGETIEFSAQLMTLNSRLVDVPSSSSLVFPTVRTQRNCFSGIIPGAFWIVDAGDEIEIHTCTLAGESIFSLRSD